MIKRGQKYRYKSFPKCGIEIKYNCLPDSEEFDGGLPGICIKWFGFTGRHRRGSAFVPCCTEKSFWSNQQFKNMELVTSEIFDFGLSLRGAQI